MPRPPGGKALARLVSELTRVGLDVHAEAAALFGAPEADPAELVADVAGPGYVSPGPYLGGGLVEQVAERYHRVAEELAAQDAADQRGWRCLGPMMIPNGQTRSDQPGVRVDVSGRVAAIAVDPRDPEHILVGAAAGGIWESRDGGGSWSPRTDHALTLAIGALVFDPDSATVLAGTGEGNSWSYLGAGVLSSADGGTTSTPPGPGPGPFTGKGFYDLIMDGGRAYAATTAGLHLSDNAGQQWIPRRDAVTWSVSAGTGELLCGSADGVFRSADRGDTWTAEQLPGAPGSFTRLAVAFAPSDRSIAYAWGAAGTGALLWVRLAGKWFRLAPPDDVNVGQASYDWFLAVAPDDPGQIYCGAVDLHRGDNSGLYGNVLTLDWTNLSTNGPLGRSIHPDQHVIAFAPDDPATIYVGNDGGLFRSPDRGLTWQSLNNGLVISEVEYLAQNPDSARWLIAGTQDNGTLRWTGSAVWDHVSDGDGGDCAVNQSDPSIVVLARYRTILLVSFSKADADSLQWCSPRIPPGEVSLFYAPVESSATTGDTIAVGYTALYVSRDNCARWSRLPFPGARTAATAMYIPDGDHVYVGTRDGRVFTTSWDGSGWKPLTPLASARPGVMVSDLYVDPADRATLWLTNPMPGSGALADSCVWRSGDSGQNWTSRSTGLPPLPINAIAVDPQDAERVWLAADLGVYESRDSGQTWHPFSNGLPNAIIGDLLFHARSRKLRAATRSRGVWELDILSS